MVVQPLDPRLGKVQDVMAGALMDDGRPLLILDVEDMLLSVQKLIEGGRLTRVDGGGQVAQARRKRVLVVDDSLTVRELERKLLVNRGYEVAVAVDGMDGWNMLRSDAFDLVVTDVDMPRMDGIELVSRIKADPRLQSLPVMVVSYKDREEDRRRGWTRARIITWPRAVSTTTRCWMPSRTSSEGRRRENRDRQRFADRGRNPAAGDRAGAWPGSGLVASNGQEAVEQCARDRPDVVLMDLIMPVMDGVEATRRIMAETPCAIVVVTVDAPRRGCSTPWATALDAADTPVVGSADPRRRAAAQDPQYRLADRPLRQPADADAGGPAQRTAGFPAPAGDRRFGGGYATWHSCYAIFRWIFRQASCWSSMWMPRLPPAWRIGSTIRCRCPSGWCARAKTGRTGVAGRHRRPSAYAGRWYPALHRKPKACTGPPLMYFSIAWRSTGAVWRWGVVDGHGTGRGPGLKALRERGCLTIAQDQATSAVYGMPKAAAAMQAAVEIRPLDQIAPRLIKAFA